MRIAVTADPYIPVPPELYGGIERVVSLLVNGLVDAGHDVVLLAHPESDTRAELVPYGSPPHRGPVRRTVELAQVGAWLWRHRHELDVVHSFGRLAALVPILPSSHLVKIQSYQRAIPWSSVARATTLASQSLSFTACSTAMVRNPSAGAWRTIYNCVDVDRYELIRNVPDNAPLIFLGRIESIKGTHEAIQIALRSERPLVIAGNRVERDGGYFADKVAPFIDDRQIRYMGPVDDRAKNALLGTAAALLMPIAWDEPFGIVMAEALACGTPVIGFSRGSVPEVIRDGETGFVVANVDEAVKALAHIQTLSREAARHEAEERFSSKAILRAYLELYEARVATARAAHSDTAISTASIAPAKK